MSNKKLDFPGLYMKATYDCAQLKVKCDDLTEEISRLRDENDKLRAALKPFAESCEHYTDEMDQDHYQTDVGGVLTVGNFRAAAAAIRESGDE